MTAPFPRAGPGEPSSPPSSVLRSRYDSPPRASVGLCLHLGIPHALVFSCSRARSRCSPSRSSGLERCCGRCSVPAFPCGHKRDLSGFLVSHPVPLPCSETPAEPVSLAIAAFPVLPPDPTRRRLQHDRDFEAGHRASVPAVYASRATLPSPMQDSLPAGGLRLYREGRRPLWITTKGFRST